MFRKRHPQSGSPTGTLLFRGGAEAAKVQILRYSAARLEEIPVASLDDIIVPTGEGERVWIDIAGIDDPDVLRAGGRRFGLSELTMENIVNVPTRPKTELLRDKILTIAQILTLAREHTLSIDQLSLILGPDYVISVHGQSDDFFEPIRQQVRRSDSRIRQSGPDYLAYALLDAVVDGYFPVLESLGERLEFLENQAIESPQPSVLQEIHRFRSQLLQLRRVCWPMREALDRLHTCDTPLLSREVISSIGDTRNHAAQVVDVVEMYRESANALIGTYMSSVAHRSNEIMKVLTMVSSIFVPLTFIAGIYGMNFEHMPELSYRWSYPLTIGTMLLTAAAMVHFFYRRKWFGNSSLKTVSDLESLALTSTRTAGPNQRHGRLEADAETDRAALPRSETHNRSSAAA